MPQVLLRHVVHGQVPGLVQELRAERVEDGLSCDETSQPIRHRVEVENGARRRIGREVEAASGRSPNGPLPDVSPIAEPCQPRLGLCRVTGPSQSGTRRTDRRVAYALDGSRVKGGCRR